MLEVQICISSKDFFKESKEVQNAIICGAEDLYGRIRSYEDQNIEFCRIFNDDKIKYDKHGQFFTFKFQKMNMQIRILYSYLLIDDEPVLLVADFFVKKRKSNKYINRFDSLNNTDPLDLYCRAEVVYSA